MTSFWIRKVFVIYFSLQSILVRTTPSEEEPLPETCNATKDDEPSLDDSTCCVLQDGGPSQEGNSQFFLHFG